MSQFTSIKIKLNNSNQLATLLAEYSGDCEIKIWVVENNSAAWTGELSSVEAQQFISHYKITKEIFLKELQNALTSSDPEVLYSIDEHEHKGYVFVWKKSLDNGITIKNGEMTLEKVSAEDVYGEVLERSLDQNSQLKAEAHILQKEREDMLKEKEMVLSLFEKTVKQKEEFEKNIYSQFLSVLNAKKERISELQETLDKYIQSKGSGVMDAIKPKDSKQSQRCIQRKRTGKDSSNKEKPVSDELDPFEVDTDTESDVQSDVEGDIRNDGSFDSPAQRPIKRDSADAQLQSQSFSFDSFDEVSSPVPALPKRSKLNFKQEVKRTLVVPSNLADQPGNTEESEENLLDQL